MSAPHRITKIALSAVGAAAVGLAVLASAGPAAASTADDTFIAQMQAVGVTFVTPAGAIKQAHQVCTELASGETASHIALEMQGQTNLTSLQTSHFIVYATKDYCPQYTDGLS
jgi:Protein of unknown function (DUF732)